MKPFAVALVSLVLVGGLALVASTVSHGASAFGPVYTVSGLAAGLADNPRAWMGRTVLVRGVAGWPSCPPNASCAFAWPSLIDAGASMGRMLPLSMGPADPLLALLRRLPLVGRLVPGWQVLHWGRPAIYRVQVQDVAGTSRNGAPHYRVLLLDPAPPGHGPMPIWHGLVWHAPPTKLPIAEPLPPITAPNAIPWPVLVVSWPWSIRWLPRVGPQGSGDYATCSREPPCTTRQRKMTGLRWVRAG
jgi:hypothetical protein